MNAIEKFAKEHGAEYEDEKTLAPLFKKAVQDTIGNIGKVPQAWTYTGSNNYGYVDWEASVVDVDGMIPGDEIVIVLSTNLENGHSWIGGRYMDENDTIAELDYVEDPFDAVSLINKLMSAVQKERSSKGESKKNERGSTQIETYDGFDELLGYADAEYLLEDVVDVLSKYYTYEGEGDDIVFDEDQAKDDPEFTIKIEGGDERADFYSEDIFYVHLPNKEAAEELAKVLGGELNESKKDGDSIRDTKCVRCGGSPAMYKLDGCSGNFCLSCAKELHWECPKELKDKKTAGKKESMERCDSCGAVMTEYDYDRYGGLCKRCRDKGEAKKPAGSPKKSEGIGDRIKMGIDYNMFMRMCRTAAYLDEDEDYWDALWEYYSETGEIEDALVFFDNLFQYTAWCDVDELYDEYLDDKFKDDSKSKEECIDAAIDGGDLQAYKHENGNYLVIL